MVWGSKRALGLIQGLLVSHLWVQLNLVLALGVFHFVLFVVLTRLFLAAAIYAIIYAMLDAVFDAGTQPSQSAVTLASIEVLGSSWVSQVRHSRIFEPGLV